jgi:hypothetical protein
MPVATYSRPEAGEYPAYFDAYLAQVSEPDPIAVMTAQLDEITRFFSVLPRDRADFAYAPGKWTVKEVIGHLSDTERVMAYRALRFARGDGDLSLHGFDENAWVPPARFGTRSLGSLVEEWVSVRRATLALFDSLPAEARGATGIANGRPLSVRTVAFMLPGHVRHHLGVIRERYLAP